MKKRHQYQDAFDSSLAEFKNKNPVTIADLADASWEEPFLSFKYLNAPLQINWQTGEIAPEKLSVEEKIIIYQYLAESCSIPHFCSRWLSFLELPGGQHHYQPFIKEAFIPLSEKFGNNLSLFCRMGEKLGGIKVKGGDASFRLQVLPKISLLIMLWEKDDEFPARASILFDSQASCHLSTASLYMLGIEVAKRFLS